LSHLKEKRSIEQKLKTFFVILFSWLENWRGSNHLSNMQQQKEAAKLLHEIRTEKAFVLKLHVHIQERN
jgi:hypothetical protein